MKISVVGSGYVGLVAGACLADLGHDVIVVDNDHQKLAALNRGEVPIHENFLPELLDRHRGHRLTFTDDLQGAVRSSAAIFVAVGTPPTERGEADLSYVESVASGIAADRIHSTTDLSGFPTVTTMNSSQHRRQGPRAQPHVRTSTNLPATAAAAAIAGDTRCVRPL